MPDIKQAAEGVRPDPPSQLDRIEQKLDRLTTLYTDLYKLVDVVGEVQTSILERVGELDQVYSEDEGFRRFDS